MRKIIVVGALLISSPLSWAATIGVTTNGDSGAGTLRAAILAANTSTPPNRITFAVNPSRISPLTPLPTITNSVLVDGTSQSLYDLINQPLVFIDGKLQAGNSPGLSIQATGVTIRAMELSSFTGTAINVQGSFNTVEGCWIRSNAQYGIAIAGSANIIGGTSNGMKNVVHENASAGIVVSSGTGNRVLANWVGLRPFITNAPNARQDRGVSIIGGSGHSVDGVSTAQVLIAGNGTGLEIQGSSSSNVVRGVWFGLDVAGTGTIRNASHLIINGPSHDNVVGGANVADRNLFGSSSNVAIGLFSGASNNIVAGNRIGMDAAATHFLTNLYGVAISDSADNTIGLPDSTNLINNCGIAAVQITGATATRNRIAYNVLGASPDVMITSHNEAGVVLSFAPENHIGPENIIAGASDGAISIFGPGANSNSIIGNIIGANILGAALNMPGQGIVIADASANSIGDGTVTGRNIIADCFGNGITITGTGAVNNIIHGNWLGVAGNGTVERSNRWNGVFLFDAPRNWIGRPGGFANIISGSFTNGIHITGTNATRNVIVNNIIGLDVSGTNEVPNNGHGIEVDAALTRIGGSNTTERNIIAGNQGYGVVLRAPAYSNWISASFIGTRTNGFTALSNALGGVLIESWGNLVGGTTTNLRNVIVGNDGPGVLLTGPIATNNTLLNNYIGIASSGMFAPGNNGDGVRILNGASRNVIGSAGAGNAIGGNASNGVFITGYTTTLNRIAGNLIGTYTNGSSAGGRNFHYGVRLRQTRDQTIGGTNNGDGNLIAGNLSGGIQIEGTSSLIRIWGNKIGTDITGFSDLGNGTNGVTILDSGTNQIGGVGLGNIISGNGEMGIAIIQGRDNVIQGNLIGTAADGISDIGNGFNGVVIVTSSNRLGGVNPGEGNRIAWHTLGPAPPAWMWESPP